MALGLTGLVCCGPAPVTQVEILEVRVVTGTAEPPSFALDITGRGFGRSVRYDFDTAKGTLAPEFYVGILSDTGSPVHLAYPPEIRVDSPHQMRVEIVRESAIPTGIYRIGLIEGEILLAEHPIRL